MRRIVIFQVLLFLLLGGGWVLADGQGPANTSACESKLDISTLPPYASFIKSDLPDLEDYFTCKAAVKEDIQICNTLSDDPALMANCRDVYNRYYASFGKLYKTGHLTPEGEKACLNVYNSKTACDQLGEVLLTGNAADCEKIEGITQKNIADCQDMVSSDPESTRALFMMILRKGDPASCDQIQISSIAAVCKGILIKNADGCQSNAGVDRFKKSYCQHLST